MEVTEMIVDLNDEESGVFAVSLVDNPAIESHPIALSKDIKLAQVEPKKQVLMGALLIPDKEIPRVDEEGNQYAIKFSKETCHNIMYLYMRGSKQNNTTEEHEVELQGNTIMEMWQKEDMIHDKSAKYGLNDPVGTIMITMKIPDKSEYDRYVQENKGFSLEGNFIADLNLKAIPKERTDADIINEIKALLGIDELS